MNILILYYDKHTDDITDTFNSQGGIAHEIILLWLEANNILQQLFLDPIYIVSIHSSNPTIIIIFFKIGFFYRQF